MGLSIAGFVMVEQVKSIDFSSRRVRFIQKAPLTVLNDVLGILDACLY
jgi:mRNA interferase MazF